MAADGVDMSYESLSSSTVRQVDQQEKRVIIETDRHRLVGSIRLPVDSYRSRLSDFLNSAEREFIALTDVTLESLDRHGEVVSAPFVIVSRQHIVLAMDSPAGA
jgi:hypothetical protein